MIIRGFSSVAVVSAVNRDAVLSQNLMCSPDVIAGAAQVVVERGYASAGAAYNAGLQRVGNVDVVAFIHQDVYLPMGWLKRLQSAIIKVEQEDPNWGVMGVVGIDLNGNLAGEVWDNGLGRRVGTRPSSPTVAQAIDEIVIIIRRNSNLTFDPKLPGFHLYAADLIQSARLNGMRTYIFDGPVIHNSLLVGQLDMSYRAGYKYIQDKWREYLPIPTCVIPITRLGLPLIARWLRVAKDELFRGHSTRQRNSAPDELARRLGYEPSLESVTL